jgi:hypothetical protein
MSTMIKQAGCLVVCVAIAASGCATTGNPRVTPANMGQQPAASRLALVEYMQKLPAGTLVRVNRAGGHAVHGTLMKATDQSVFVQPKTRLPEAIVEIPVDEILTVTPSSKHGQGVGRAIAAGAAAGVGATLVIFWILFAVSVD